MARLQPNVYVEMRLARYPASAGTTVYRWARFPMADTGSWKEQRLVSLSTITRKASDLDGNYFTGSVTAVLNDQDGVLRALMEAGTQTEYWTAREATVFLISDAGRAAASSPRPLFRGFVENIQALPDRMVELTIVDAIGSQFGTFNLDKTLPGVYLGDIKSDLDVELRDTALPIYCGEFSDLGAKDENGTSVEKGLCPVFDLGDVDFSDDGAASELPKTEAPRITKAVVVGVGGDETYYYFASVITAYGETMVSSRVTVTNAPSTDQMSTTNYVAIEGTFDAASDNRVRIWGRSNRTATHYLDEAFYNRAISKFYYNDGAHPAPTPTRVDIDHEKRFTAPATNTAVADTVWGKLAVCIGYDYEILDVFGSDLVKDDEPRRVKLDSSVYGSTVVRPSDDTWPHDDPWIEENGIRYTAIYVRGPLLNAHRDGSVTIAVTLCGPHDDSDLVINQAANGYQWLFNEHVLKNGGTGYRTGSYGTLETYANGDSILHTAKFATCQDATKQFTGDTVGYTAGIVIDQPVTVREIIRRATLSHGFRWAHDHFGRFFPFVISDVEALASGRHFRRHIEIHRPTEHVLAHDEVRNVEDYTFHWDVDAGEFRFKGYTQENAESIAAHTPSGVAGTDTRRGVREGDEREMYYANVPLTADDVVARALAQRARRPRYISVPTDLTGLEYDITSPVRITDEDGLGTGGDAETPAVVLGMEIDTEESEVVLLTQDHRFVNRSRRLSDTARITDTVQVGGLFPTENLLITDTVTVQLGNGLTEALKLSETVTAVRV